MGAEFQIFAKEFIVNVWEARKQKLYGDDSCPNQLQSQSSPGGLGGATGVEGQRDGKFGEGELYCVCYACRVSVAACNVCVDACACTCGCKCKCGNVHSCMDTCARMCSSAHSCGWVADGGDAMAAFCVLLLLLLRIERGPRSLFLGFFLLVICHESSNE